MQQKQQETLESWREDANPPRQSGEEVARLCEPADNSCLNIHH